VTKPAIVVLVVAACSSPARPPARAVDTTPSGERDVQFDLVAELQDEVIRGYLRDEPPEIATTMLVPTVGSVRIGVGPGDVLAGDELRRTQSRWPLDLDPAMDNAPRSKNLAITLAKDRTAAWISDEVSWRLTVCGRAAVIPLRATALYARDGERWVMVFEHLSFGQTPMPTPAKHRPPRALDSAVADAGLAEAVEPALAALRKRSGFVIAEDAIAIGPDIASEWRGAQLDVARLVPGVGDVQLAGGRLGTVGRTPKAATIAYWVGNLITELPARPGIPGGTAHYRATFVFERRDAWRVASVHVSQAIEDGELANAVFGTALISPKPLAISCDDAPTVPAPKPPGKAPAAGSR
jgi:hypothetical protein